MIPKGAVADHWTWRDGVARVTGWHFKAKGRAQPVDEPKPSTRGVFREAVKPKRPRPEQAQLL